VGDQSDKQVQTDKETRKHGDMLPTCLFADKWRQGERVDKPIEKSAQRTIRERIHALEIVATTEILTLGEFISTDRGRLFYIL